MVVSISSSDVEQWLSITQKILDNLGLEQANNELRFLKRSTGNEIPGRIVYKNRGLAIGGLTIPLSHRPMTAKLVRSFFQVSDHFLSKDDLIEKVYDVSASSLSPRMKHSLSQNAIKLMSRSRSFLDEACEIHGVEGNIRWFYFDRMRHKWGLYEID